MVAYLAGDTLPAAQLNRLGCRLRRVANQTVNDASTTVISWDTEDIDNGGFWAIGTPTVITVTENGVYGISFGVLRAAAVTARSFIEIIPSTGPWASAGGSLRFPMQPSEASAAGTVILYLASGNTFTVQANLDGAGNSTMTAALECWRLVGGAA